MDFIPSPCVWILHFSFCRLTGTMSEPEKKHLPLFQYKGFNLITGIHNAEELDKLYDTEIYDSDIFIVTYPKSGTIWMQQIMSLIETKGVLNATFNMNTADRIPWVEADKTIQKFASLSPPRIHVCHLPWNLTPKELRQKKGKIIYVSRNPKDVLVSFYHFHKFSNIFETPKDFNTFLEKFLNGNVFCSSWFNHIKGWYTHKDDFNILFLSYEEMIQDLRSSVKKMCTFLDRKLSDEEIDNVVEHSQFHTMKNNSFANYRQVCPEIFDYDKGSFMRKGIVGDWKKHLTVEQNEKFDEVFQEKMQDVPIKFIWRN
ncbi:amine sulfotransferase-like isoform X1 [Erpetoichthys calabaricus]|uniref:amine sulfotransferase-like isoform X1 n=1 Tax=Erpetoichthys calabaricus TaxID=27687 RepID=UPI002234AEA8|nr:amine sulfotransferase-like isoform X1 [Erpetoichthys calabaricus]